MNLMIKHKNFRYFIISTLISSIGDIVDDIAFMQLIYLITKSTMLSGYVFIIKIVMTFLSVFTSAFVDRFNKKNIIIYTSILQAIILIVTCFLYITNNLNITGLIIIVSLQAIFSTFSIPAKTAILGIIVENKDVIEARAFIGILYRFIEIFSYLFSGVLIAAFGLYISMIIDIVSFIISALVMFLVVYKEPIDSNLQKNNFIKDVKSGLQFIFTAPIICVILFLTFIGNMLFTPIESFVNIYLLSNGFAKSDYSIYMLFIAVGGIIGNMIVNKLKSLLKFSTLLSFGFLCGIIGICLLFFINKIHFLYIVGAVFNGMSLSIVSVVNASILQMNTEKSMMARVFSVFKCISYIAGPLGIWFVGFFGDKISLNNVFLGIGVLMIPLIILPFKLLKTNSVYLINTYDK